MKDEDVRYVAEALKEGNHLYIFKDMWGTYDVSIITSFEQHPAEIITSCQHSTIDEALLLLNGRHERKEGPGSYAPPELRKEIDPIHNWLSRKHRIVGKYAEGRFQFHAKVAFRLQQSIRSGSIFIS